MKFFLLHNRRHLGPYTLAQLEDLAEKKSIPLHAYVISEENSGLGQLNYLKLSDVIELRGPGSAPQASALAGEKSKVSATLPPDEVKFIERTFDEAVDPLDLVGNSSGVGHSAPSGPGPAPASDFRGAWKRRWRSLSPGARAALWVILAVAFLGKGYWGSPHSSSADRAPAVLSESEKSSQPPAGEVRSPGSQSGGASLSQSLNLGPAMPTPTIRVPQVRAPSEAPPAPEAAVDVEDNLVQGEPPEPTLLKRRSRKTRKAARAESENEDSYDAEHDPEREGSANEDEDSEEEAGTDESEDVAPHDPVVGED